ncbi:MAG: SufD family Fe-S cluster assembly protein, partial [bacterium]|nr:SufD family Fe-S cluster assembly protein [bacterium]
MIQLSTITSGDIQERGLLTREPKWMRQQRLLAWEDFKKSESPNWIRSKIPKVDLMASTKLKFPSADIKPLSLEKKPPAGAAGKITLVDGKLLRVSLLPELAHKGVILSDMQSAVLERADLLEPYLLQSFWGVEDLFTAFHRALWSNGYFLYVPKGVTVDLPIQVQVVQKDPHLSILDRSLMILDQQASVTLEELYESEGSSDQTLVCATATEAFVGDGARLQYFSTQNWGRHVYDLS